MLIESNLTLRWGAVIRFNQLEWGKDPDRMLIKLNRGLRRLGSTNWNWKFRKVIPKKLLKNIIEIGIFLFR
jgi:hypothetical protein